VTDDSLWIVTSSYCYTRKGVWKEEINHKVKFSFASHLKGKQSNWWPDALVESTQNADTAPGDEVKWSLFVTAESMVVGLFENQTDAMNNYEENWT